MRLRFATIFLIFIMTLSACATTSGNGGAELIALGIEKGPQIGRILKTLLAEVVDEPEKNTAEYLTKRVKEWLV